MGHNGGPDWRALIAGEDTKALETVARYQSPADFLKAFNEQRAALSKRAEPARLADNATPEQVAEFRKALGVSELPADAKPEQFMQAYKIEIPQGYEASEVEKGMLGDFAKLAYEQGHSPREVKAATDFFFKQQQANQQAINRLAVDRQQEYQGQLKSKWGRDYDAHIAAADTYLKNQFAERPDDLMALTRAQLPGGGYVGDHPAFVELMADLAAKNGFTDRIEANVLESGGKALGEQVQEIEKMQFADPAKYNLPETQRKLEKLLQAQLARGEIDEQGNPVRKRRSA